jgi:hypothetical protein
MSDFATGYHLVVYALLIVVAMPVLACFESRRFRVARVVRTRREGQKRRARRRLQQASGH